MKMNDMGKMTEEVGTVSPESPKKEKYYPRNNYSTKQMPELAKHDIGDMVELHSVNKVVGKRENEDGSIDLEMEMMKCGTMGKGKVSEDEYKDMSNEEKDKVDEKEVMGEE